MRDFSHFTLSAHACIRMQQRCIGEDELSYLSFNDLTE